MAYRMLLVEDDAQIREVITDYFQKEGQHQVTACADGEAGLAAFFEQVELADMTEALIRHYAKQAEEKNISIQQNGSCSLAVNATWFHSVLKNLIDNAVQHGKEGSVVTISMDSVSYTIVNSIRQESGEENRKGMGMEII